MGDKFASLDLKIEEWWIGRHWRHHEACVKAKQSCEGVGTVGCARKYMDGFAPQGCVSRIS